VKDTSITTGQDGSFLVVVVVENEQRTNGTRKPQCPASEGGLDWRRQLVTGPIFTSTARRASAPNHLTHLNIDFFFTRLIASSGGKSSNYQHSSAASAPTPVTIETLSQLSSLPQPTTLRTADFPGKRRSKNSLDVMLAPMCSRCVERESHTP
jgi:hypothetical protein